jgi:hypothetical protein
MGGVSLEVHSSGAGHARKHRRVVRNQSDLVWACLKRNCFDLEGTGCAVKTAEQLIGACTGHHGQPAGAVLHNAQTWGRHSPVITARADEELCMSQPLEI